MTSDNQQHLPRSGMFVSLDLTTRSWPQYHRQCIYVYCSSVLSTIVNKSMLFCADMMRFPSSDLALCNSKLSLNMLHAWYTFARWIYGQYCISDLLFVFIWCQRVSKWLSLLPKSCKNMFNIIFKQPSQSNNWLCFSLLSNRYFRTRVSYTLW